MTTSTDTKSMKNFVQKSKFLYFYPTVAQFRRIINCLPKATIMVKNSARRVILTPNVPECRRSSRVSRINNSRLEAAAGSPMKFVNI